jgi:hypothetical protein
LIDKGNTILFHPFLLCNYHYNLNHAENKYYNYYNKGSPLIRYKLKHVERKYYNMYTFGIEDQGVGVGEGERGVNKLR